MSEPEAELTPAEQRYMAIHDNKADPVTRHKTYAALLALSPEEHLIGCVGEIVELGYPRDLVQSIVDVWKSRARQFVTAGVPLEAALRQVMLEDLAAERLLDEPEEAVEEPTLGDQVDPLFREFGITSTEASMRAEYRYSSIWRHRESGESIQRLMQSFPLFDCLFQTLRHLLGGERHRERLKTLDENPVFRESLDEMRRRLLEQKAREAMGR